MNMNRILRALLMVTLSTALAMGMWGVMPAQRVVAQTTYTWNQTGTGDWTVAANWTPSRDTPAVDDILQFNGGGEVTVTNVPMQTIGQLLVTNNTIVNLQAGAASNILTIAGDVGTDLDVQSGALNMTGASALIIFVGTGATGSISGNMTCSGGTSKLNAQDAGAITFNSGSIFTQASGCTGNVFTNSGTANVIVFANGSTFVFQIGSNPFGLTAPNSKVVFQSGSLYRHESTNAPAFSGRTYANFELNAITYNGSSTGGNPCVMDDLTITAANTMNLNLTGGIAIRGNISIASGTTLGFNPASANIITLGGTSAQAISGDGTLTLGAFANIVISNTVGVTLQKDVAVGGNLTVNPNSILDLGTTTLAVNGTLINNGTLQQTQDVNGSTDVNFFNVGGYGGLTINASGSDLGSTAVSIKGNQACDTDDTAVNRCFDIAPTNATGRNATITFYYDSAELNSLDCDTMNAWDWSGALPWTLAGTSGTRQCTTDPYSLQVTGVTTFSPFALRSGAAGPTSVGFVALGGSASLLPVGMLLLAGLVVLRKRK